MRRLLSFVAQFGMLACFPLGIALLFVAWQLQRVAGAGRPQPQALTLAELIDRGPGDNVHIQLSKFAFDKPVVETNKDHLRAVWVALYPPGKKQSKDSPAIVFRTALAHDQSDIEDLLTQKNLSVIAVSALPECRLKVYPAAELYEAYPKLDPTTVTVLADPALVIQGRQILTAEQLFNSATPIIAWGSGAGVLALGCLFMVAWRRFGTRARHRYTAPIANLTDNFRLTERSPVSTHESLTSNVGRRVV